MNVVVDGKHADRPLLLLDYVAWATKRITPRENDVRIEGGFKQTTAKR